MDNLLTRIEAALKARRAAQADPPLAVGDRVEITGPPANGMDAYRTCTGVLLGLAGNCWGVGDAAINPDLIFPASSLRRIPAEPAPAEQPDAVQPAPDAGTLAELQRSKQAAETKLQRVRELAEGWKTDPVLTTAPFGPEWCTAAGREHAANKIIAALDAQGEAE